MRQSGVAIILPLLLFLLASACDSSSPIENSVEEGRFSVTIQGDVSQSFEGSAYFAEEENQFTLVLSETDPANTLGTYAVFSREGGIPSKGAYRVGDLLDGCDSSEDQFGAVAALGLSSTTHLVYILTVGDLDITTSTSSLLKGSFEATRAYLFREGQREEASVTIKGDFSAYRGTEVFRPLDVKVTGGNVALLGQALDSETSEPIASASVTITASEDVLCSSTSAHLETDSEGRFQAEVRVRRGANLSIEASKAGYANGRVTVLGLAGRTIEIPTLRLRRTG